MERNGNKNRFNASFLKVNKVNKIFTNNIIWCGQDNSFEDPIMLDFEIILD